MRIGSRGTPTESRAPCVRNCTCASEGRGSALRRQRAEAGLKSLAHSCEARRTLCAPYISNYRLSAFSDLNMLDSHELGPAVPLKKIANRHDDLAERPLRSNMIRPQYGPEAQGQRRNASVGRHRRISTVYGRCPSVTKAFGDGGCHMCVWVSHLSDCRRARRVGPGA
jgi:hypothetical protein